MMENEANDDSDFIVETANDLRAYVGTQVETINKTLTAFHGRQKALAVRVKTLEEKNNTQETEIRRLREENGSLRQSLDKPDKCDQCLNVVQRAFESARAILADPTDPMERYSTALAMSFPSNESIAPPRETSTPEVKKKLPLKRKAPQTVTILHESLEDIEPKFREIIEPFYKVDKKATSDFLNDVQRAFVKYRASTLILTKESICPVLAQQIITEGCTRKIWTRDMTVGDGSNFETYLLDEIKK